MLHILTAAPPCADPDAVGISRRGDMGQAFGPSEETTVQTILAGATGRVDLSLNTAAAEEAFEACYLEDLRRSLRAHADAWELVLAQERVVLVCRSAQQRRLLVRALVQVAKARGVEVVYEGDLAPPPPPPTPAPRREVADLPTSREAAKPATPAAAPAREQLGLFGGGQ